MSRVRNALSDKDRTIWFMAIALVVLGGCLMFTIYRISVMATEMDLHLPPDVSKGATLTIGKLPLPTAYTYARYVWQNINTWKSNGAKEYEENIDTFSCFLSPEFREFLKQNVLEKRAKGELNRTRQLSDAHLYKDEYVNKFSDTTFGVWLDQDLKETVRGQPVKAISMRYPLYLVADQRPCNVLGYSLGGFMESPSRL